MSNLVSFGVFDKEAEIDRDRRFLPHWFQPGVATFITFRTADSMPREVVEQWKQEIKSWLAKNGIVLKSQDLLPSVEELKLLIGEDNRLHSFGHRLLVAGSAKVGCTTPLAKSTTRLVEAVYFGKVNRSTT